MSAQIKTKIVSIIRSDFDQTPKYWEGDGWYDNAEEVADDIIALFSSPAPAAVEELLSDPIAVHINMLRGTIAKPSLENIQHLYPEIREEAHKLRTALSTLAADKARAEAERDAAQKLVNQLSDDITFLRKRRGDLVREKDAAEAASAAKDERIRELVAAEREACAQIAEAFEGKPCGPASGWTAEFIDGFECGQIDATASVADAIRARAPTQPDTAPKETSHD